MGNLIYQMTEKPVRLYIYKNDNEIQFVVNIFSDNKIRHLNIFLDELPIVLKLLHRAQSLLA